MLRNPAFKASAAGNLPHVAGAGYRPELKRAYRCFASSSIHRSYHIIHTDKDSVQYKHELTNKQVNITTSHSSCKAFAVFWGVLCDMSRPEQRRPSHFLAVKTNSLARESLPRSFGSRCNVPRSAQSPISTWSANTRQTKGMLVSCGVLVVWTLLFHAK